MFSLSPRRHFSIFAGTALAAIFLVSYSIGDAQSLNGVNSSGTYGNEIIEGTIHFPAGKKSGFQPIIKLHSDTSSGDLTALPNSDGSFRFTHLRTDSYTVTVEGGDEYQNARESVIISNPGPVPGQGNPLQYAHPLVYQVDIYLQPKNSNSFTAGGMQAALARLPQPVRDIFNQGIESARAGDVTKAIARFQDAISQSPNFALAYNEMGRQYLRLGQPDKAAESFAAAVKLEPENFESRLNYGFALLNLSKFSLAEEELRYALQKNAASGSGHYYLGLALMNQKKFEPAIEEFKTSVGKSNDGIAAAHKYLGGIYWRQKQFGPAADELEKYLALEPKAPDAEKIRDTIKDLRAKS
ncbi:MAG TPA: tetratricopeptide repeat protein [Pyrinomonadaceae bacterium]|jgi:tetratricopeptide (TPR) repeat protein|nr:tetratricopeptide repeat protein [Pyrinomonadaceae bacterium]